MSAFTGSLTITQLDVNWRSWKLEQDLTYVVDDISSGKTIVVPKGFVTDGASIPKIFWSFLPPWGSYSRAAVIHDYLLKQIAWGSPNEFAPTRKDADKIFLQAMGVCNTGLVIKYTLYLSVRIWGLLRPHPKK